MTRNTILCAVYCVYATPPLGPPVDWGDEELSARLRDDEENERAWVQAAQPEWLNLLFGLVTEPVTERELRGALPRCRIWWDEDGWDSQVGRLLAAWAEQRERALVLETVKALWQSGARRDSRAREMLLDMTGDEPAVPAEEMDG